MLFPCTFLGPRNILIRQVSFKASFSVFYCIEVFLVYKSVFHVGSACFQIERLLLPNYVKPVNNIHCSLSTKYCVLMIHISMTAHESFTEFSHHESFRLYIVC